ncbi:peptidoglycan hydrolase CwlO-like protein [Bacillus sp. SLBN-46]|jgi:peptidoglycan hydrolase CwlO-like protein|uniref:hypothetical protein n=1 Tax=Bacillus sp. SLBN-46 TaxID=3042283 RepID=UPI0028575FB4|nr:hypothetical protein [Bacillus sp. SLBN-46]MDR6124989.1 peptidoglycan hydrolase CwlO-like protein [Bacillus sp. SLBN-46]
MLKKVFAMLISILLLVAFGTSAFAAETKSTDYDKVIASIEKTNYEIEEKIAKAVSDADKLEAKYISDIQKLDEGDTKYNERTEQFTNDLDKLITDLYNTTLKMSTDAINKAAEKGIQAEAYWTLVEIGGRLVWIDPIRVCH